MRKRFLSILLSLAMVLTMIPFSTMTAFAATSVPPSGAVNAGKVVLPISGPIFTRYEDALAAKNAAEALVRGAVVGTAVVATRSVKSLALYHIC